MAYDLYCPFDIEKHKRTFINYLEVIIRPDGVVEYAVPSHTQKLESILCEKLGISLQQLHNSVPQEYYFDYSSWLCQQSGCILMWDYKCIGPNAVTPEQMATIQKLRDADLYKPETKYLYEGEYYYENRTD
jgi:hypothetical protein